MKAPAKGSALWVIVIAAGFVVAQAAVAAIPSSDGTIHGCYNNRNGSLRVIDQEAGKTCGPRETELSWSQQGPPGETLAATGAQLPIGDVDSCDTNSDWSIGSLCDPNPGNGVVIASDLSEYIDPSDFPDSAIYSLRGWLRALNTGAATVCIRVYDFTADAPLEGTTACFTNTTQASPAYQPVEIDNVSLPSGEHLYGVQSMADPPTQMGGGGFTLFVDW